mgnify:CR=1 FL=1
MKVNKMREALKTVETITFSKHFYEPKVRLRGISEEEVIKNLKKGNRLIVVEDRGEEPKGHKYALLFKKSNKYDLKVVVSLKGKNLNVITAHIQSIKRRKVYEKWLERRR